ncbi:D-mannonate oxidoreductase [Bradyrhizobium sp. SSBR45G]|uniref:mannitol dehydrogenase family protein n=1 Tax=unclassified Bradyrhizobium TaxID=2631580 RepID=UPI0023428EAE|nr:MULTISPECIES: mannitol dehydrogenase family protein [unclassified Bradyrhizobium]GLH76689.1 D-mannonate oxidoreductase [Bradyrhizobium sp. SSBR45G]GLH84302.1 D-mannonate oxidoreductase [Bradyrhizobium sp. SSBR45R]
MTGRILQFGTSRFLQAHVDLFVHEARAAGQTVGPITVVQTSAAVERSGRIAAFGAPGGYPVIIRGLENGAPVERRLMVSSVDRGLSAIHDWAELRRLFATSVDVVVLNTGDTGYDVAPADRQPSLLAAAPPASFPGKLTALLHHRWQEGGQPLTILPCELLQQNGRALRDCVVALAEAAQTAPDFRHWLGESVLWVNTLVDRIVSEAIEPIGAIAEPYALWAIERQPGLTLPFSHPSVVLADDLEPFERLKLHILNLGHTVLADLWLQQGKPAQQTVRQMLAEPRIRSELENVYRQEVLPGFAMRGMRDQAEAYMATTLERFLNPFLAHRLADIAQNHAAKVERRIAGFLAWAADGGAQLTAPVLRAIVARAAGATP